MKKIIFSLILLVLVFMSGCLKEDEVTIVFKEDSSYYSIENITIDNKFCALNAEYKVKKGGHLIKYETVADWDNERSYRTKDVAIEGDSEILLGYSVEVRPF